MTEKSFLILMHLNIMTHLIQVQHKVMSVSYGKFRQIAS